MDKIKQYISYIVLIVGFAILSNALIKVGLNGSYKKITRASDNLSQVVVYQAEATNISGRIRGVINNDGEKKADTKYLKIDFYSSNDVKMGSKYVEIDKKRSETPFEVFFELNDVQSYKLSLVNEKDSVGEIELIPKDLKKPELLIGTALVGLLFW